MKSFTFSLVASALMLAFAGAAWAESDAELEFKRADKNGDGLVSPEELRGQEWLMSGLAFDVDQDGAVSREEWNAYLADAAARKNTG